LKRWVAMPLRDVAQIEARQQVVEAFVKDADLSEGISEQVALVGDLERIASRIAAARVTPRELVQLKHSLTALELLKAILDSSDNAELHRLADVIDPLQEVRDRLATDLYPDPTTHQIQKGGVIADGVDPELDDLRRIALHGKDYLARIQQREREATGIPSLKLSYNNVFGYYIEVSNTHKDKVPQEWIRKQTLTNAERYITEELKEYEEKILGAEEKMLLIEQRIYAALLGYIASSLTKLLRNASVVARIDCLHSFAVLARQRRYVRPTLDEGKRIEIREGRHPVLETLMGVGEEYIPNDVMLDDEEQQIIMITGPNMSGKSALLRQTALIVLMAQMGSFVPAKKAHIGVVDKIFTRVGASDNISQGESTFMVEMLESAGILNNISDRSLVLLDEIGRGTSTYDGISIAWAMVEYLHNHPTAHAKTLFATHYHELNEMAKMYSRVKNFHVSVREVNGQIVFLRKLEKGGTEHSFGIHVARLAGMPASIVARAEELLHNLEVVYGNNEIVPSKSLKERNKRAAQVVRQAAEQPEPQSMQLSMFQLDDPVLVEIRDRIKGLDINSLTPIEALNILNDIKKITGL
ncbi:MAG: DNA mismatch repair protein MutS, partial [Alistipes sp.]|nr:DNA mismatch repair protein MutS [Alistipes sp.]